MENFTTKQIIRTVLSPERLSKLSGFASAYATNHVQVISDESYGARTTFKSERNHPIYEIILGSNSSIKDDKTDLMSNRFTKFSNQYLGLFYHEFFHVLYTNFIYVFDKLKNAKNSDVHNFIITILNICEDFYIESIGQNYFPHSEKFIKFINNEDDIKEINKKFEKMISDGKLDNPDKFIALTWLLINSPVEFSKTNIYKKDKEFYDKSRQKLILTFDSRLRAERQILFATELLKMLNNENYKPEFNENKNVDDEIKNSECDSYVDECDDETIQEMERAFRELSSRETDSMKNKNGCSENVTPEEKEINGEENEIKDQDEKQKFLINKKPIDLDQIPVNSEPSNSDGIFLARMSNYKSENVVKINMRESNSTSYIDYINENCNYINQIQNIINRIRLMCQGEIAHNQKSGKFDRKSACKQYPTLTPFKRNIAPKILPDLVFHLIVDGSGSMSGKKEKEAINALLLFTTALERLGIPFAIEYFNDGYENIERIIVKEYNDKIQYKKRLAYIYNNDGWCAQGNIDEINILHASQDLKARKERDKFMIVFSDGMTCGSEDDLHNLIIELDKQGLNPIGIGLGDRTVCGIYPTSIYLKNNNFDELISFLKDCLLRPFYKNLIK